MNILILLGFLAIADSQKYTIPRQDIDIQKTTLVGQKQYSVSTDDKPIVATSGVYLSVAISIYDPSLNKASLGHFDGMNLFYGNPYRLSTYRLNWLVGNSINSVPVFENINNFISKSIERSDINQAKVFVYTNTSPKGRDEIVFTKDFWKKHDFNPENINFLYGNNQTSAVGIDARNGIFFTFEFNRSKHSNKRIEDYQASLPFKILITKIEFINPESSTTDKDVLSETCQSQTKMNQ
jgi:hypothetical protein